MPARPPGWRRRCGPSPRCRRTARAGSASSGLHTPRRPSRRRARRSPRGRLENHSRVKFLRDLCEPRAARGKQSAERVSERQEAPGRRRAPAQERRSWYCAQRTEPSPAFGERRWRGLLPGYPEAPAALRGARLARLRGLRLGRRGRLLGGRGWLGPALRGAAGGLRAAGLRVHHLQLRERLADGPGLGAELLLDERQQRADALDRQAHLAEVALVLGAGDEAGAAAAEVHERDQRLHDHVLDPQLLDLLLVGGAQLFLGRRAAGVAPHGWSLLAHAAFASWTYVSRVSSPAAPSPSRIPPPASIARRWRWAPFKAGNAGSIASSARTGAVQCSRRSAAAAAGNSSARSRSISLPSCPRRIARQKFSSIRRRAGSAKGTPSSSSRAACATHATIRPASASASWAVDCASQMRTSTVPKLKCGRIDHQTCVYSTIDSVLTRKSM